jgi:hypothetical protein
VRVDKPKGWDQPFGVGKVSGWLLRLLGTTLLGLVLASLLSTLAGWAIGLIAEATHASPAWIIVPAVAAGTFVFIVLMIFYVVRVGPWLVSLRPEPEIVSLRPLADDADSYARAILSFERRDPDGQSIPPDARDLPVLLAALNAPAGPSGAWNSFDSQFGQGLRNLFHQFKDAGLVGDGEEALFYSPRTADNRVALAARLKQLAYQARERG